MPFVFFGLIVIASGFFLFFHFGIKKKNSEMRNGSLAWILAGFFLLLWGMLFIFTSKL